MLSVWPPVSVHTFLSLIQKFVGKPWTAIWFIRPITLQCSRNLLCLKVRLTLIIMIIIYLFLLRQGHQLRSCIHVHELMYSLHVSLCLLLYQCFIPTHTQTPIPNKKTFGPRGLKQPISSAISTELWFMLQLETHTVSNIDAALLGASSSPHPTQTQTPTRNRAALLRTQAPKWMNNWRSVERFQSL